MTSCKFINLCVLLYLLVLRMGWGLDCISSRSLSIILLYLPFTRLEPIRFRAPLTTSCIDCVYHLCASFEPRPLRNLLNRKRSSIAHNLSLSTSHRPDMTETPEIRFMPHPITPSPCSRTLNPITCMNTS